MGSIGLGHMMARKKLAIALEALEEIRTTQGKTCAIYEICEHVACDSSYAAWAIADKALHDMEEV